MQTIRFTRLLGAIALVTSLMTGNLTAYAPADWFDGQHFHGRGNVEYLDLLDIARRMFGPDPLPLLAEDWERWGDGDGWQVPHPVQRAVQRMAPFGDPCDPSRPYVDRLPGRHRA